MIFMLQNGQTFQSFLLYWMEIALRQMECLTQTVKACVRYFSLFLKQKCISSLFRAKYIEKEFNSQLLLLPIVWWTFILAWATTRCPPSRTSCFEKINSMCNRDIAHDVDIFPDEIITKWSELTNQAQTKINTTKGLMI